MTLRSAMEEVIGDMILEELAQIIMENLPTELQLTNVGKKYENLMPLSEYCTLIDQHYDQHEHIMVRTKSKFHVYKFCSLDNISFSFSFSFILKSIFV